MTVRILIAGLLIAAGPLQGSSLPAISRDAAQQSAAEDGPAWISKVEGRHPRLFFTNDEWKKVREEVNGMQGPRAQLRDAYFAKVQAILNKPIPVYETPEEMTGKRGDAKTLYSAREELWQREVGDEILALALAAQLKGDPAVVAKMKELVLAALEYPTWGQAKPPMGNNADLAAGHLLRGISAAYDWHGAVFTPEELAKIRKVVAERAPGLLAGLYGNAFWARGFEENHNHVSVCGLGFAGAAFLGEIPEATEWLAASRLNFQSVLKSLPSDGSSVEGVSYWAYGIGYILQYIEATRKVIDSASLYDSPFLRNAGAFRLMASTSGFSGNVPWGDAVFRDWVSPQYILHGLASQYQDANAAWLAENLADPLRADVCALGLSTLWARNAPPAGAAPSALDARLSDNDMATSRNGWRANDYVLSVKAGHTNRNHSHLDAGALALAFGDEWVLVAPGYGKGGGEGAFWDRGKSGRRWQYFSNATESHSTLLINGKNQRFDDKARARITEFFSSPDWAAMTVDLTGAYADASRVERRVLHRRGEYILVLDAVEAPNPVSVEWLAQFRKESPADKKDDLWARGTKGRILIRLLDPQGGFSLRTPTSPKVDPPKPQFTYAAKSEGTSVRFAVLLQPIASGAAAPALQTGMSNQEIEIRAPEWTDSFRWSEQPQEVVLGAAGEKINAKVTVVRAVGEKVVSFLALGTSSVALPGVNLPSGQARDVAGKLGEDGRWIISPAVPAVTSWN
jgi:hypothetical protein